MSIQLETDKDGNVIVNPVTGWTLLAVARGTYVLLVVQYSTPGPETASKSIQFLLTPKKTLELSEELGNAGKLLLADDPHPDKPSN